MRFGRRFKMASVVVLMLAIAGCSGRGMDHVVKLKEIDQLQAIAQEMPAEEAQIFEQTVIAEVNALVGQIGLMLATESLSPKDPSRDAGPSRADDALKRLESFDGKTARALTLDALANHRSKIQEEKNNAQAAAKAMADIDQQLQALAIKVKKVDIRRENYSGRATDVLSISASVEALGLPALFVNSFEITPMGNDGKPLRPAIVDEKNLMLPCSECDLYLHALADPAEGLALLPKSIDSYQVRVGKWSLKNAVRTSAVDIGELDQRLATLDRKIALVSKTAK